MESLPDIVITHEDLVVLAEIVEVAIASGRYDAASRLGNELHRARVVPASRIPEDRLVLNAAARFRNETSMATHDIVLVPGTGSAAAGTLSVLTQIGTALIGLAVGQRMCWQDAQGGMQAIRLLAVGRHGTRAARRKAEGVPPEHPCPTGLRSPI